MSATSLSRREWFEEFSAGRVPATAARPQSGSGASGPQRPLVPRDELVNVLEYEAQASRVLSPEAGRAVAGSDRVPFDRITLRPRMMVNCMDLNLSAELAGHELFAPIIVGPVSDQRQFHPEGERATARGAAAAKTMLVVSNRSSFAVDAIGREATAGFFYQVFASDEASQVTDNVSGAIEAGCKALLITVGQTSSTSAPGNRLDWTAVNRVRRSVTVPVMVKGVMSPEEAKAAVANDVQGVVVSNYGQPSAAGHPAALDVLPAVVDAVGDRVPVLVDGGFRRGTDIIKALAFGARAVLVARPAMWGLAAYGAEGVQAVLEMLQTELGRVMACCGKPNLAALNRAVLKVHRPQGA